MKHMFDTSIAEDVGIKAAVILEHIVFWIEKNAANDKHFHDGKFWTYSSNKAFSKLFPYLTTDQIRRSIENLKASGYIVAGNYNTSPYDRTMWYAMTEKTISIYQNRNIELANLPNQNGVDAEPIPDIRIDIRTDTKENITKETSCDEPLPWETPEEEVAAEPLPAPEVAECVSMDSPSSCFSFEEFWSAYGKRVERVKCERIYARIGEKDRLVIRERLPLYIQSTPDKAYRKNPQTYLNGKCWNDDIIEPRKNGRPVIDRTEKGF